MIRREIKMAKRYLFLVSVEYALPVLRELQKEILKRGDQVRWFFDKEGLEGRLNQNEEQLKTAAEVVKYNPEAVFTCGNHMYHFFPGVKVQLFHGYPLNKRNDKVDDHFKLRGWFDIYCTQGPSSTQTFQELAQKKGYFKVYETGWPKADLYHSLREERQRGSEAVTKDEVKREVKRPTVLYSSTFTKSITSTRILAPHIERMVAQKEWEWIFMFHPKLEDREIIDHYQELANKYPNAKFATSSFDVEAMKEAEVMLCDASSIIIEFMMLRKPVVTFRNTQPGKHLIDITSVEQLQEALKEALQRPEPLMRQIEQYVAQHDPYIDGKAAQRVLKAVDLFVKQKEQGVLKLKRKPLNMVRKIKARKRLGYWR